MFFAGLHLALCSDDQFLKVLNEMAKIMEAELTMHQDKQVIFRSTLPTHTIYAEDGSYIHKDSECWKENSEDYYFNHMLKDIAKRYRFRYLNSAPIYMERGDLHYEKHVPMDCVHWCFSPETYVPEVALINNLLR